MYEYDELKERLQKEVLTVDFQKQNGQRRTMVCTLIPSYLPTPKAGAVPMPIDTEVMTVWDIDTGAWRRFRLDSIFTVFNYEE